MMWIACGVMWVACAAVAIAGVMVTKSPWCLWIMMLPALVRFGESGDKKSREGERYV